MNQGWWSSPRLRVAAAALVVINGFFPAVWILFTSLKREVELVQKPITWWPHAPTLHNYVQAFTDQPLLSYMANSFIVAGLATVGSLLVSTGAAYAIARLNLRRRQAVMRQPGRRRAGKSTPARRPEWRRYRDSESRSLRRIAGPP